MKGDSDSLDQRRFHTGHRFFVPKVPQKLFLSWQMTINVTLRYATHLAGQVTCVLEHIFRVLVLTGSQLPGRYARAQT